MRGGQSAENAARFLVSTALMLNSSQSSSLH
jgi:hypothetical protein